MSPRRTLIVKGVSSPDDLSYYGLPIAERYSDANTVILVADGKADVVKNGKNDDLHLAEYIDVESTLAMVTECMTMIREAWEERYKDDSRNLPLGHAAAGMWFFYWSRWCDDGLKIVRDLIAAERGQDIHASALEYIACGFGAESPKMLESPEPA